MSHNHSNKVQQNIKFAFFLNLFFTVFEIVGGVMFNSMAILSDALHDFGDCVALGLSWHFEKLAQQGRTNTFSYGYKRFSLLAAVINSIVLIVGGIFVLSESIPRLMTPEHSNAQGMLYFALLGIFVNGIGAWRVSHGHNLNEKTIMWHLLEDVIGWISVLVVSIVMIFWDIHILDPILSIIITVFVCRNAVQYLQKSAGIFLQAVPAKYDMSALRETLISLPSVIDAHDLHVWSLDGESHVFSGHLIVDAKLSMAEILTLKCSAKDKLNEQGFSHVTLEIELEGEVCDYRDCFASAEKN